ncbi:GNAT family N-acetyltransferase [Rhodobacterales bacterium HKCCE3408]|nr:GNAT family N-acetyltransferase [Rhodobacterales bacterium HKCCE3408]
MGEDDRLGRPVPGFVTPPRPDGATLTGRYARLERLSTDHAAALHAANAEDDAIWDYLPYGPFTDEADYRAWVASVESGTDPLFYTIFDLETGRPGGVASYLRIAPEAGSIEVGHINLSPRLQRTRAATEAMFLMMQWAYEAGYRRYEWKCNALNLPSRRAAERLGFSYEGVFRQAGIAKGRNRDTAWFASIDGEWPKLEAAFTRWLDPENFDAGGRQRVSLSALTRPILVTADPAL